MHLVFSLTVLLIGLGGAPHLKAQVHFEGCPANSEYSANILLGTAGPFLIDGADPATGDEIAVYTPEGTCAGSVVWDEEHPPQTIVVWSNNSMTTEKDGFAEGDSLFFRVWSSSAGKEFGRTEGEISVGYGACEGALCKNDGLYANNALMPLAEIQTHAGESGVSIEDALSMELPGGFKLSPAYPNPFNPGTKFELVVAEPQEVTITVYNMLGQLVQTLHSGNLGANRAHTFHFEAGTLATGIYIIRAHGQRFAATQRVVLMK